MKLKVKGHNTTTVDSKKCLNKVRVGNVCRSPWYS